MPKRIVLKLFLACLLCGISYVLYGQAIGVPYILKVRLLKVGIFVLVSVCSAVSTLSFQSVVGNRFLTPSILGVEAYYRFLQTLLIFFGVTILLPKYGQLIQFVLVVLLLVGSFLGLSRLFWKRVSFDLHTVLLIGLVLSMVFGSLSTFLQVLLDPNEYDRLQMRLFPTFQNVPLEVFLLCTLLAIPLVLFLWKKANVLEVLAMGREQAINLGIAVDREMRAILLVGIILAILPATLVGPMLFLGFVSANLAYLIAPTFRIKPLFLISSCVGFIALTAGQFMTEHVFALQANSSILIEWFGGILFFVLLWRERKIV